MIFITRDIVFKLFIYLNLCLFNASFLKLYPKKKKRFIHNLSSEVIICIGYLPLDNEKTWLQYECDRWGLKFNLESKLF